MPVEWLMSVVLAAREAMREEWVTIVGSLPADVARAAGQIDRLRVQDLPPSACRTWSIYSTGGDPKTADIVFDEPTSVTFGHMPKRGQYIEALLCACRVFFMTTGDRANEIRVPFHVHTDLVHARLGHIEMSPTMEMLQGSTEAQVLSHNTPSIELSNSSAAMVWRLHPALERRVQEQPKPGGQRPTIQSPRVVSKPAGAKLSPFDEAMKERLAMRNMSRDQVMEFLYAQAKAGKL